MTRGRIEASLSVRLQARPGLSCVAVVPLWLLRVLFDERKVVSVKDGDEAVVDGMMAGLLKAAG